MDSTGWINGEAHLWSAAMGVEPRPMVTNYRIEPLDGYESFGHREEPEELRARRAQRGYNFCIAGFAISLYPIVAALLAWASHARLGFIMLPAIFAPAAAIVVSFIGLGHYKGTGYSKGRDFGVVGAVLGIILQIVEISAVILFVVALQNMHW